MVGSESKHFAVQIRQKVQLFYKKYDERSTKSAVVLQKKYDECSTKCGVNSTKSAVGLTKIRRIFDKNVNKNTKLPKIVLKIG